MSSSTQNSKISESSPHLMMNPLILNICKNSIRKDLGTLDDLPYELANTIANVYYRAFYRTARIFKYRRHFPESVGSLRPRRMGEKRNFRDEVFRSFRSEFQAVADFVREVRAIDETASPDLYWFAVKFILDCLKYDIQDVGKKTELRRVIERQLKKPAVREVPGLVEMLNV